MKRIEWLLVIVGFILITINFSYAFMRQRAAEQLLQRYDKYAQERDRRWNITFQHLEEYLNRIEAEEQKLLERK